MFLDADAELISNEYIVYWLKNGKPNELASGGRVYSPEAPDDLSYYLHWLWGTNRELQNPELRNQSPENNFLSNNFLIEKKIALQYPFNEKLIGYGYEDALFAFQLSENGVRVVHHFNPVKHIGLDSAENLLRKIDEAMLNLLRIEMEFTTQNKKSPLRSKLLTLFNVLRYITPATIALKMRNNFKAKLLGSHPTLSQFDLYRLFTLIYFHHQNHSHS